jgi:hypothetical protein
MTNYYDLLVGYIDNSFVNNYLSVSGTTTSTKYTYTFTMATAGEAWIGVEFYNPRMYPYGCKTSSTTGLMKILKSGTSLIYTYIYEWNGMNAYHAKSLAAGTYTIEVTPTW